MAPRKTPGRAGAKFSRYAVRNPALGATHVREHALTDQMINSILIQLVCDAENNLCMELQGHMHEKMATFNVMSVRTLSEFIRQRTERVNEATLAQVGQSPENM